MLTRKQIWFTSGSKEILFLGRVLIAFVGRNRTLGRKEQTRTFRIEKKRQPLRFKSHFDFVPCFFSVWIPFVCGGRQFVYCGDYKKINAFRIWERIFDNNCHVFDQLNGLFRDNKARALWIDAIAWRVSISCNLLLKFGKNLCSQVLMLVFEVNPCLRLEQSKILGWTLASNESQNCVAENSILGQNGDNQTRHGIRDSHGSDHGRGTILLNKHGKLKQHQLIPLGRRSGTCLPICTIRRRQRLESEPCRYRANESALPRQATRRFSFRRFRFGPR